MPQLTDAEIGQAKADIARLAADERMYRDTAQWDLMHASYHDESHVRVYWFNGTGRDFIEASRFMTEPGQKWSSALHVIGPTTVQVDGDRAIADTGCTVNRRSVESGIEIDSVIFVRHRSMVERDTDGAWKLRSFRAVYERDAFVPVIAGESIPIDKERLATYRPSYKFMCYFAELAGRTADQTLPGMDRPDLVDALIAEEEAWLGGGTYTPKL
jgi:hypothetical protein